MPDAQDEARRRSGLQCGGGKKEDSAAGKEEAGTCRAILNAECRPPQHVQANKARAGLRAYALDV